MQKIIPHLWFDTQAVEAAKLYVSLFENSRINSISQLHETPSGDVDTVDFELDGVSFSAISAGPYFQLNPSISLMVTCRSAEEVDRLYEGLKEGSEVLMPLGEYPFSKRYVWLADKYGLNWQLTYFETDEITQKIRPSFLFAGDACGKTEEALAFYRSVFLDTNPGYINRYQPGEAKDPRARINYAETTLLGLQLVAMDHGAGGTEAFNEAFSLMVLCKDQAEIDDYWQKLSAVPEAEQCGWLKDRFGVSWQIVPEHLSRLLASSSPEEAHRITQAFLGMKKLDIAELEKARLGK
ncbi:MAG: VOC family protein [Clostridiales bacterium]|nr:VOC family protein [Clostridiales bacterium]